MRQFEIWWADLPEPAGRRPVLLLSRSPAYAYLSKVIVVEVTTTLRSIPQELGLGRREGLPRSCVANFDNVHVISKARLARRIGALSRAREVEAKRAFGHAVGWPELMVLE